MPLTDLVRHLNSRTDPAASGFPPFAPFVAAEGAVFVHFANLRLESTFQPIVETASGKTHGHAGTLRAFGLKTEQPVTQEAVFVLPSDDREFIYLDRLVRTLHTLNYLTHRVRGNLLLKVHQRHVLSVASDHGLAFEEILRPCGLLPEQITLEIDPNGIEDIRHLERAVENYHSRGYRIALGNFGHGPMDFNLLRALKPNIVKLDPQLLSSTRPLLRLIDRLHDLGALVLVDGVGTPQLRHGAATSRIDLLQAPPLPDRALVAVSATAAASRPAERKQRSAA
jgi:EAL domain-containing protein (putative c-di-GMP-specific phosphodiesterase class I)